MAGSEELMACEDRFLVIFFEQPQILVVFPNENGKDTLRIGRFKDDKPSRDGGTFDYGNLVRMKRRTKTQ
jgi:hypothetical protein